MCIKNFDGNAPSDSEETGGYKSWTGKRVTFSMLVHLMSNSDVCSVLHALQGQANSRNVFLQAPLGYLLIEKQRNVHGYLLKLHYLGAFTRGWQISIRAGLHLLFWWSIMLLLIQQEKVQVSYVGLEKNLENKCELPSISPRHIVSAVVKLIIGCLRLLAFWHSCQTSCNRGAISSGMKKVTKIWTPSRNIIYI